jgi:signal transduction histidine kinase
VASVIGLLRLISDPESDPLTPAQAEQIELIRSSATDLLSLVNDLLDLAKAESGRLDPVWTLVDLGQLFKQLRGTIRAVLTTPEVQLVVDVPDDGSWIESDEAMLSQVLRNLLHNAVKFTDAGEVSLRARCQDGAWIITVADTGIGIAPAHHERIFEEFYQLPSRARVRGTGLGLPYARKLVTVLGGSLGMESEPGRGSVFTVTLPVSRTPPVAEQP